MLTHDSSTRLVITSDTEHNEPVTGLCIAGSAVRHGVPGRYDGSEGGDGIGTAGG
jgi:hypothetical protein